ncbi:MAG: TldD/PmbA family protein [Armatimonadetes bacterium]|nr:TldD/PmbA family protein [Armatimonadota bacterium]
MDYRQFAQDVVAAAMLAGAHEAEVYLQTGSQFDVNVRLGDVETLTQASSKGLGLRVFVDKRMAFASTTDFGADTIADMVRTTVQLAKQAGRDRFNGLPDTGPAAVPDLELFDHSIADLATDRKIEMARESETAALSYDDRITNSYGGGFSSSSGSSIIANSNGICCEKSGTYCGIGCAPLAEQEGRKEVASYGCGKRFLDQLEPPDFVGREAARRAVQKLGARKVETQKAPVVFEWSVASILWDAVFDALDGEGVHRGMSFLKNKLGKRVASPLVTLMDDPLMRSGIGSMPFDGEGVPTRCKTVVEDGILRMYFYDARTARRYGDEPSGNARRGYSGTPSIGPTNFYLRPTQVAPEEIVRGISNGFYVTETMGHGISAVTGDFSVGASGMWIRDGELAFPVHEVTIAGNMLEMMLNVEQIGDDAKFTSSIVSPTFKIAEMTVSGK